MCVCVCVCVCFNISVKVGYLDQWHLSTYNKY